MADKIKPYLEKETLKTKDVYYLKDNDEGICIKAKEEYKNNDKVVHFPWGRDYRSKYPNIKEIEYIGFKGKLPKGVFKNESRGYGFTKVLSPLFYYLDETFKVSKVTISKTGTNVLDKDNYYLKLNSDFLNRLYPVFSNLIDRQKKESRSLVIKSLVHYFPGKINVPNKEYSKNTIYSLLEEWGNFTDDFSELDIKGLLNVIGKLSHGNEFLETSTLIRTKEVIEAHYIEDVIKQYKELLDQKTETKVLEDKWQEFLKIHSWIFSFILSLPVIIHDDQAYVGGKNVSNKGGKITDYLIKNDLTNNVAFVEIKTHRTELVRNTPYRGSNVFPVSVDLTGSINQVLNQRDCFQKEFWTLRGKSKADFQSLNSKCVVLAGMIKELSEEELESFELFRGNSKDVFIITFDELLSRIQRIQELLKQ